MATLTQYWNDEVTRIGNALDAVQADLTGLRAAVAAAEAGQRSTADAVRAQSDALAAARRALAGIAMPADGDPLLVAMEAALVALHGAQAALAAGELSLQAQRAELQRAEQTASSLAGELAGARLALERETAAGETRQDMVDLLTTGGLATLVADVTDILNTHQATATSRVEDEFPSSATPDQDFLTRVRARRALVQSIAASSGKVEEAAFAANNPALAQAQRTFTAAAAAVQAAAESGASVAADSATLARLAALPAPNPPTSYSILTRWQHDHLHDASKQATREATLAELAKVDDARQAVTAAQEAYAKALDAALKAEPDKTVAQLDATTLSTEKTALDGKLSDLSNARNAYNALAAGDRQALDEWFAAVPDALWAALDDLDGAVARLEKLKGPPTPGDLITAMNNAETALEAALRAARLAERQTAGGQLALQRAGGQWRAERDTAVGRAVAMARCSALF